MKFNPPTEAEEQEALFKQIRLHETRHPELAFVFMIPNGAKLHASYQRQADGRNSRYSREGQLLKLQGLRPGVPDIFCPVPKASDTGMVNHLYCGLFIELKRIPPAYEPPTEVQKAFHAFLREQGYKVKVCKGWREAWNCLVDYLGLTGLEVS